MTDPDAPKQPVEASDSPGSPGSPGSPSPEGWLARTPPATGIRSTLEEPTAPPPEPPAIDYYLNRELTWLNFAWRVVQEAEDPRNPLLERVRFLAIVGSTLDEFFMKRIGGLKSLVGAGMGELSVDGRTPRQQISEAYEVIRGLETHVHEVFEQLQGELSDHGIGLRRHTELGDAERAELRDHYLRNIFPLVTPQSMDPAHPFPFISNLSLNLLVTLRHPEEDREVMARVKVPVGQGIPRLLRVGTSDRFVPLEEVMADNLDLLFPGMTVVGFDTFRVTRNADTEGDEDQADDLLAMIESELRERKFAPIVRVELPRGVRPEHRRLLAVQFELEPDDVFEKPGLLGVSDMVEICGVERPDLRWSPHRPIDHPQLPVGRSIFRAIRDAGAILLHHPYESFHSSVQRFLREASTDRKVRAIKMTLYRTSEDSEVADALVDAARNGKQVAVVVELKARFDEAANIRWATYLEEAGIHVSYGVVGLKTHCKVILVVRQDRDGLRRYAHIGTGNYHAGNARGYTDLGLLTCDQALGHDLGELFNYLTTGYRPSRNYLKILKAPTRLKSALLERIEREIEWHRAEGHGLIQMKMNALEDADITRALYQASRAGVRVDLIVRDTCRARPGLPGLSETMRVVSIVGRFLEHSRIYYFRNGGEEAAEYFIGSADLMNRNLESRVEVLVPVETPALRAELREVLDIQLADTRAGWEMQSDGSYIKARVDGPTGQEQLIERAEHRLREAAQHKRRGKRVARR
ncbi:polyphosphate kinase 1 [Paraliomyxa miuraensis]|uniref:polyphosphate kinase 1 n=1 Tax=Paraliomyxa miuraensis TaxID=376150 RepID=UPI00224D3CB5|nr:polyphosphate kinase 1 [Paraliomyxa miuraensis]MCX4241008.1 polyphosphate kinase 1 [Paraliomyxa miuraensis]